MKHLTCDLRPLALCALIVMLVSCKGKNVVPDDEDIRAMNLKRGEVVLCGPADKEFGTVSFKTSCSAKTKKETDLAIALLHSFEYDEAEKVFARIIDAEPGCAIAYWGIAMCNYHQVWPSPPTEAEMEKGMKAITIAQSLPQSTDVESALINAIAAYYTNWQQTEPVARSRNYAKAMESVHANYPDEKEAAIFYALSLVASADPADKTYRNQKKAGEILTALYPGEPTHPGIVHYIIHSYDYPELAERALPAARKYASIAPSSAHAQHMPSHIFTRLGLWNESIQSNLASTASAKCYAESSGINGHWDEELHGLDYLVYAYLQKGENDLAKQQYDYLKTIKVVVPMNFKVAYAFAAIPSRYFLENKRWKEAADMEFYPTDLPWEKFPWQKAIIHFTRLLGSVHTGNLAKARTELNNLYSMQDTLTRQKDLYKANQVMIQVRTGEAWVLYAEGKIKEAIAKMTLAADLEDKTEKSPVTPGEVLPAKELLGDMLLLVNNPAEALIAYESCLIKHPNRFNSLYGAALASEKNNDQEKAKSYYRQLTAVANSAKSDRSELVKARSIIKK